MNINDDDQQLEEGVSLNFNILAGIISSSYQEKLKRIVFRVSKGRAITTLYELKSKYNTETKSIFFIVFQGGVEQYLKRKIIGICDLFSASRYSLPHRNRIPSIVSEIFNELTEKQLVLGQMETTLKRSLEDRLKSKVEL